MDIDPKILLEIFGYLGTALVIVSMLMTSIIKLRIINMCGSVISATYSAIMGAWPIVVLNTCLFIINAYQIFVAIKNRYCLSNVKVPHNDETLEYFISMYKDGIKRDFPEYNFNIDENCEVYLIYHKNALISIFVGKAEAERYILDIDYTIPGYKNTVDDHMFAYYKKNGIKEIVTKGGSKSHNKYLRSLGFREEGDTLVREL